ADRAGRWVGSGTVAGVACSRVAEVRMAGLSRHDHGAVGVLMPENGGRYPYGNSLLIRGSGETVLVDPSLAVGEQGPAGIEGGERVDAIVVSHGHEDHLAGV